FDAAVDVSAYARGDTESAVRALGGRVGRLVHIGTGQVYLVRRGASVPAREEDYDGPLVPEPDDAEDRAEWEYGIGKRGCEDALEAARNERGFPSVRLRIPIVHGERDPKHRMTAYLARLADGKPVLLPEGGRFPARHVDVRDVAGTVARLVESGAGAG